MENVTEHTHLSSAESLTLREYAGKFSQFEPHHIQQLGNIKADVYTHLPLVTDLFYKQLLQIQQAEQLLEGRVERLRKVHHQWLESLFSTDFGDAYTQHMYHIGHVHVRVKLPVEFVAGGTTLLQNAFAKVVAEEVYPQDHMKRLQSTQAFNAATDFSLLIMQKSYQAFLQHQEEHFLKITGISRQLFQNLARSYSKKDYPGGLTA